MQKRAFALVWIALAVTSLAAATPSTVSTQWATPHKRIPAWKVFKNAKWGYQFRYPSAWTLNETSRSPSSRATFDSRGSEVFSATPIPGMTKLGPELFKESAVDIASGLGISGFEKDGNRYYATTLYEADKVLAKEENVGDMRVFVAHLNLDVYASNALTWKGTAHGVRALVMGNNGTAVVIQFVPVDKTVLHKILTSFVFSRPPAETLSDSGIPPLYGFHPPVGWSGPTSTTYAAALYYTKAETSPKKSISGEASLAGRMWRAKGSCRNWSLLENYYDKQLALRGWVRGEEILVAQGFGLQPISADGPLGSARGYVRGAGDEIQEIIFSYQRDPANPSCGYSVFLSSPVKFDSILPK